MSVTSHSPDPYVSHMCTSTAGAAGVGAWTCAPYRRRRAEKETLALSFNITHGGHVAASPWCAYVCDETRDAPSPPLLLLHH